MKRVDVQKKYLSSEISVDLNNRLDSYLLESGLKKKVFIARAIQEKLDRDEQTAGKPLPTT